MFQVTLQDLGWERNPFFKLKELSEFLSKNEIKDYEIDGLIYKQVITVTRINGGVANNVTPPDITLM